MKRSWSAAVLAGSLLLIAAPAWAKTVKECNAEYAANKATIKGTQKKADFITACKAGTEVIPGAAAAPAAPAATVAPAPAPPVVPAPAPAPAAPATKPAARMIPMAKPAPAAPPATLAPTAANQFQTEAQAQGHCAGGTIVWVNTKSGVYHFVGTKNYGNTKAGAYMCEPEAMAAGDRASKTEKHP